MRTRRSVSMHRAASASSTWMRPELTRGAARLAPALALALALGGCSREVASSGACDAKWDGLPPAYGDALVEGTIGDASTLIPMLASDSASHAVAALIFDGLLTYDKNLSDLEPR